MIMSKERKKLFAGRWGKVRLQELELSSIHNLDVYDLGTLKMFIDSRLTWWQFRREEQELHREKTEYEERYWTYDDPSYKFTDYALGERFDNEYDDIEDLYYEG